MHAVRASQALSRLTGLCSDESSAPYNPAAADSLRALLTPKLASMLKEQVAKDLLGKLNTNLETPEVNVALLLLISYLMGETDKDNEELQNFFTTAIP